MRARIPERAKAGPSPTLGRRGRKEDAGLPTLPTVDLHEQRARPICAPPNPSHARVRRREMPELRRSIIVVFATCACLLACGGQQTPPNAPTEAEPKPSAEPTSAPAPSALTAEACEASGGVVVGDIGDGAIHRPDYRCPSGAPPKGDIHAPEGGPIAIEGSVCCPR